MELYILRHGIAENTSATGRDEDRKLTVEGRKKLRETLETAAKAGVKPTLIMSSPYTRAVETANIAAEELGYNGDLAQSRALIPDAEPAAAWHEVRTFRDEQRLLLTSHNPLCARLAGYLLASPTLQVDFKKGALMRIDFDQFGSEPHGLLKWLLVAKLV